VWPSVEPGMVAQTGEAGVAEIYTLSTTCGVSPPHSVDGSSQPFGWGRMLQGKISSQLKRAHPSGSQRDRLEPRLGFRACRSRARC
jgi:hypothetical protein